MLRRISVRQATAYLLYLVTNASLFNLTKVWDAHATAESPSWLRALYEPCFSAHREQFHHQLCAVRMPQ